MYLSYHHIYSLSSLEEKLADSKFVRLTEKGRARLKKAASFISAISVFQTGLKPVVAR